jgi:hypothetical protein
MATGCLNRTLGQEVAAPVAPPLRHKTERLLQWDAVFTWKDDRRRVCVAGFG